MEPFCNVNAFVPPITKVANSIVYEKFNQQNHMQVLNALQVHPLMVNTYSLPVYFDMTKIYQDTMTQVFNNQISVEDGVAKLTTEFQKQLNQIPK